MNPDPAKDRDHNKRNTRRTGGRHNVLTNDRDRSPTPIVDPNDDDSEEKELKELCRSSTKNYERFFRLMMADKQEMKNKIDRQESEFEKLKIELEQMKTRLVSLEKERRCDRCGKERKLCRSCTENKLQTLSNGILKLVDNTLTPPTTPVHQDSE